jgi:hypothetical protein
LKVSFMLPPLEARTARAGGDEEEDKGLRDGKQGREKEMMTRLMSKAETDEEERGAQGQGDAAAQTRAGLGGGRCLTAL